MIIKGDYVVHKKNEGFYGMVVVVVINRAFNFSKGEMNEE